MGSEVSTLLDQLDVVLLLYLSEHTDSTTTEIAREIYSPKDRRETVRYDNSIRARLKKLVEIGLVTETDSGKAKYNLDDENVFFGDRRFEFQKQDGSTVYLDIGEFIAVKTANGDFYLRGLNPVNDNPVKKKK